METYFSEIRILTLETRNPKPETRTRWRRDGKSEYLLGTLSVASSQREGFGSEREEKMSGSGTSHQWIVSVSVSEKKGVVHRPDPSPLARARRGLGPAVVVPERDLGPPLNNPQWEALRLYVVGMCPYCIHCSRQKIVCPQCFSIAQTCRDAGANLKNLRVFTNLVRKALPEVTTDLGFPVSHDYFIRDLSSSFDIHCGRLDLMVSSLKDKYAIVLDILCRHNNSLLVFQWLTPCDFTSFMEDPCGSPECPSPLPMNRISKIKVCLVVLVMLLHNTR